MAGYWDMLRMQPAMMQAGASAGNAFASAFAASKARKLQERQLAMQKEAAQVDLQQAQQKAELENQFKFAASAYQRAGTPEVRDSAMRRMYQLDPAGAQQFLQGQQQITQDQQKIEAFGQEEPLRPQGELATFLQVTGKQIGDPGLQAEFNRWRLEGRRAGAAQMNVGDSALGLGTSAAGKAQEDVRQAQIKFQMLDELETAIDEAGGHQQISDLVGRSLTQAKGAISTVLPGIQSEEDKRRLRALTAVESKLSALNSQVLNELSGAAVSEQEWERIKKSLPLMEDPADVRATKLQTWKRNMQIIQEQGVDALMNGLRKGWDGSGEGDARFKEVTRNGQTRKWDTVEKKWVD